jgi:hypothetical protein
MYFFDIFIHIPISKQELSCWAVETLGDLLYLIDILNILVWNDKNNDQ